MIEMPQLRIRKGSCKLFCLCHAALNGEACMIWAGHYSLSGFIVNNSKSGASRPRLRIRIAEISRNSNLPVSAREVGNGFDIDALYKSSRSNEQLYRPVDSAIVRPIAGTPPGQHVAVERAINPHRDRVGTAPVHQASDIKHESRITFARM